MMDGAAWPVEWAAWQPELRRRAPAIDLSKVSARQNLNETAFFFPHLTTDADGQVTMKFTMPEALTEWKFLGFAHDTQMRGGSLTDTAVTSKDLMVEPLAPRFVREGDVLEFTVKVTNQSAARQTGTVRLTLGRCEDARIGRSAAGQCHDGPGVRHRFEAVSEFFVAAAGSRRTGIPHVQGGRLDRQAVGRRRRLPARSFAAHPGDRVVAAADPRGDDQEV